MPLLFSVISIFLSKSIVWLRWLIWHLYKQIHRSKGVALEYLLNEEDFLSYKSCYRNDVFEVTAISYQNKDESCLVFSWLKYHQGLLKKNEENKKLCTAPHTDRKLSGSSIPPFCLLLLFLQQIQRPWRQCSSGQSTACSKYHVQGRLFHFLLSCSFN